ncbi:MAG: tetratricopeptide repeat protein [Sphaerochaetaceae bacterium]|nr:tetratricopeptide repeat protein [Sphaerochaetaceae bacterium]
MKNTEKLKGIVFINLPKSLEKEIDGFKLDSSIALPIQLEDGKTEIEQNDITIERIVAGMIKIVAWDPSNTHFEYYRDFVLAAQKDAINQLNLAAIAKQKAEDFEFSEELFIAVNHLAPQPASYINLAIHYSTQATKTKDISQTQYDYFQQKAFDTLNEGLENFKDNPDLLCEIGYFHVYQNNIEAARDNLEKFVELASDDDKRKDQVKKILSDISEKIKDDAKLLEAYDQINLCNEDKAIEILDDFLKDNPDVWNAHFFKGWALRRQEKFAEAKPCFLEAMKLGECNSEIYNELAICALEEGQRELALFYLDTAIDLEPENLTLLTNYALLNLEDKNYDKARYLLEKSRLIDENDPLVIHLVKKYCEETGDTLSDPINEEVVEDMPTSEDHDHEHDHQHDENCSHSQED